MVSKAKLIAADLFCGAGGTSTGLALACREAGYDLRLLAINHWQVAIDTHTHNHPYAQHRCESLDNVDPRKAVPGGRLNLLVASPECTHHSNARGGRPVCDQSRVSAWHILRWAEALYIESVLIENVREFRSWGPLGANGRPVKRLRGQLYIQFLNSLRALGYNVEDRVLNAADYGDPTTRERLFIIARRGKPVVWPEPTHARIAGTDMFSRVAQPWRKAREIIDWGIPGGSIFARKRPLADKTVQRIIAGLKKFGGANAEPFLVVLQNNRDARSLDKPLPSVLTSGAHFGLCEPFVLGQQSGATPRSVDQPLPTVATGGAISLVQPFLMNIDHHGGNGKQIRPVDQPIPTQTTKARTALVEPFLVAVNHGEDPAPRGANGRRTRSVDVPLPTVRTKRNMGLVEPFLEPFLVKYNGTALAQSAEEPLDTVSCKDRFALVTTEAGQFYVDIRFRMLHPHELARAQGFSDDYKFSGNREEVVRQIGNAVPVNLAKALCAAILGQPATAGKAKPELVHEACA